MVIDLLPQMRLFFFCSHNGSEDEGRDFSSARFQFTTREKKLVLQRRRITLVQFSLVSLSELVLEQFFACLSELFVFARSCQHFGGEQWNKSYLLLNIVQHHRDM